LASKKSNIQFSHGKSQQTANVKDLIPWVSLSKEFRKGEHFTGIQTFILDNLASRSVSFRNPSSSAIRFANSNLTRSKLFDSRRPESVIEDAVRQFVQGNQKKKKMPCQRQK
jgi:hypothetical protein